VPYFTYSSNHEVPGGGNLNESVLSTPLQYTITDGYTAIIGFKAYAELGTISTG
jgi:hypothetical protein